jgi:two-component system sensor histidine kinase KdpD
VHTRGLPVALAGSVAALAAATGLIYALRPIAPTLSLGVVYTLAVLAIAVLFGIGFATAGAVASMLAFNFLFLAPVHTLTLADGRNWTALAVYLATAIVVSELATRARRRAAEAEQREREAALLSDVAAGLLRTGGDDVLLAEARSRADRVLAGADEVGRTRFDAALAALLSVASERDRLEREARDAEGLRRSDAIKTAILQSVSHDFRTPLATMSAAVGGLTATDFELAEVDRQELLETIRLEVARLTRLVENLLDLSRLQAGASRPHLELWTAEDLLAGALVDVSVPSRIEVDVPSPLPVVRVDAVQVQRVLVNLLENALKFSAGAVSLAARADGKALVVEVLDRGPGIDPARGPGAGLGLSIAHGFASVNGAQLELERRDGGGTVARLSLPAERVPAKVTQ